MIDYTTQDFAAETRRLTDNARRARRLRLRRKDDVRQVARQPVRDAGSMALFGQSSGAVPPFDPQILNRKGSLFLTRPTLGDYVATRAELLARSNDLFDWVERGELKVRIGAEFPLADAAAAHTALAARATTGKVILIP